MSFSMRRAVVVVLGIGYVAALALSQPAKTTTKPTKPGLPAPVVEIPTDFNGEIILKMDRKLRAKLEAVDDYVHDEKWDYAVMLLQGLNDAKQDNFAAVLRNNKVVWVSIKTEANRRIGKLPEEGKKFYRGQYDATAKSELESGLQKGNWELVAHVATVYLHTKPGGEAAEILASHFLDLGDFHASALYFDRLIERDGLDSMKAPTLLKAAIAFNALPKTDDENSRTLASILQKIGDKFPGGIPVAEGNKIPISQLPGLLAGFAAAAAKLVKDETHYPGAVPSRNVQLNGTEPFLDQLSWKQPTVRETAVRSDLDQAIENQLRIKQPVLPAMFPITTKIHKENDTIPAVIFRSFFGIHAVDMRSGKLLWEAETDMSPDKLAKSGGKWNQVRQWMQPGQQGTTYQLWDSSVVGTISTDGQRAFVIDDFFVMPPRNPNWGNPWAPQPNWMVQDPQLNEALSYNQLKAYDVRSGKYLWCLGGLAGDKEKNKTAAKDLLGAYFLGTPLPLGGKLYALVEKDQELRLLCLDPALDPMKQNPVVWSQPLAETRQRLNEQPERRLQNINLSYGQGILVCPTNAGAVLGIDLMSHSLVWAHPYRETPVGQDDPNNGLGGGFKGGRWPQQPYQPITAPQWKPAPPVIEDGKVVFAPQDGADLICLNLKDGTPLWKQPREDGQYLAGVFNGKALVVCTSSVKAYNLADGKLAWKCESTGMPSGQGVASNNLYYLPLRWSAQNQSKAEPEICIIDIATGNIVAHNKSRKKELPGNLVFFEGKLISQGVEEVSAFPELAFKIAEADRKLLANPNDPEGRIERAELRLFKGDRDGAVDDLHVARSNNPGQALKSKTTRLLHEAFTELLLNNFTKNEKYLDEYREVCTVDDPEIQGDSKTAEERRRKGVYWHIVAQGREKQHKLTEAFEGYMEYIANAPQGDNVLLTSMDQPTVQARPDVWARGRITAMLANATPEQRQPLEHLIEKKWKEVTSSGGEPEMSSFVNMFGPQFKVGRDARLLLAEKLMETEGVKDVTRAEMYLLQLRNQKEDRKMAAKAVDALARLMTKKNMLEEGAYFYRVLGKEFTDVEVRDGKTGGDLFSELATDKRYIGVIDQTGQFLAGAKLEGKPDRGNYPKNWQVFNFDVDGEPLPFFQKYKLQYDMQVSKFRIADRFTNKEEMGVPLQPQQWFQFIASQSHNMNSASRFPVSTVGHVIVFQVAHMVYGIDPFKKEKIWEVNLLGNRAGAPPINPNFVQQPVLAIDPADGSISVTYQEGYTQRLGQTGPVTSTCVCLVNRDGMVALDPVSGKMLWTRSDVSTHSALFGDADYIYAVEFDENNTTAKSGRIFRAQDGVSVEAANFASAYQNRVRVCGRNILVKESNQNGMTLRLYDPLAGKDVWSQRHPLNTVVVKTEDPNLTGIVDPEGHVVAIDVATGTKTLQGVLDPKHLPGIKGGTPPTVTLLADGNLFFVLINEPGGNHMSNLMPDTGMRGLPVNGQVYAYDKTTFKMKWRAEAREMALVADNFREMPVLLFTGRYFNPQKAKGQGNGQQYVGLRAIQKSNGKMVYDEMDQLNGPQFYQLTLDQRSGKIEFTGWNEKVTIKAIESTETHAPSGGGTVPSGGGQTSIDGRPIQPLPPPNLPPNPRGK